MTDLPAPRHTHRAIRHLEQMARHQETVFSWITQLTEFAMAGQVELAAEIATLKQAVADDQAADQAVVDQLDATIAQLKADGDTTAAIAALEEIKASISTVSSAS